MPVYEYNCMECGQEIEILVRSDNDIACPLCGAVTLERKPSLFASISPKASTAECAGSCDGFSTGQCGSGMCGSR